MVDTAGVNGLGDNNRHEASDEEGNEGVRMHVGCVVDEKLYEGGRDGLLQVGSTTAVGGVVKIFKSRCRASTGGCLTSINLQYASDARLVPMKRMYCRCNDSN